MENKEPLELTMPLGTFTLNSIAKLPEIRNELLELSRDIGNILTPMEDGDKISKLWAQKIHYAHSSLHSLEKLENSVSNKDLLPADKFSALNAFNADYNLFTDFKSEESKLHYQTYEIAISKDGNISTPTTFDNLQKELSEIQKDLQLLESAERNYDGTEPPSQYLAKVSYGSLAHEELDDLQDLLNDPDSTYQQINESVITLNSTFKKYIHAKNEYETLLDYYDNIKADLTTDSILAKDLQQDELWFHMSQLHVKHQDELVSTVNHTIQESTPDHIKQKHSLAEKALDDLNKIGNALIQNHATIQELKESLIPFGKSLSNYENFNQNTTDMNIEKRLNDNIKELNHLVPMIWQEDPTNAEKLLANIQNAELPLSDRLADVNQFEKDIRTAWDNLPDPDNPHFEEAEDRASRLTSQIELQNSELNKENTDQKKILNQMNLQEDINEMSFEEEEYNANALSGSLEEMASNSKKSNKNLKNISNQNSKKMETKEKKETEITTIKGYINTHEKAPAPQYTSYDNGNSRFTLNMVHGKGDDMQNTNIVARNDIADRLFAAVNGDGAKGFTIKGELKVTNEDKGYKTLYAREMQKHQILNIEGKINHMEQNGDFTKVLLGVPNEKLKGNDSFNVSIHKDAELNGAKLEKGETIAINGEGSVFSHKDQTRSVSVKPWNIGPDMGKVNELVAARQAGSSKDAGVEMG